MSAQTRSRTRPTVDEDVAAEDDGPISQRLTFLLHRLVAVLVDASTQEFREHGLSIPAARAMVSLLESGGAATVGSLAQTTCIDLSTTSHILRRLEQLGLIARERQQADNRVVMAKLTPAGREIAAKCREASLRHEAVLIRGIPLQQVATLKRLLEQAYGNAKDGFADMSGT